ncbi:hypothetical protein LMG23992_01690 [Cupriavidus laharis]|uniref:Beta-ketoacyl synthase-like N-terminal domain-containing protein n=1 Tax=Cupriavidus laharis TaxID=151654 RepID=A0ABN7YBG3_9BURK|nr:beta-ketoacyl synthase chain length factor [Cupriavidus laharis]CAG9170648.1 hypothetical protein LMG23992_01690 [Cupriavidus laharis]
MTMATPLLAFIESIGVLGPGLGSWAQASEVLAGRQPYQAAPTELAPPAMLPPAERRRSGTAVRLALGIGQQAVAASGMDAAGLPTVFTSSSADGHNFHAICEALAQPEPLMSPTRFHNSVHNVAAGYWSIATRAMRPANVLSALNASFGAGLLETAAQVSADQEPCLLIAYDSDYPEPLRTLRPIPAPFGIALLLTPHATAASLARIEIGLSQAPSTQMGNAALEDLRRSVPTARALPLLHAVAMQSACTVVLDYLDGLQLQVAVEPPARAGTGE